MFGVRLVVGAELEPALERRSYPSLGRAVDDLVHAFFQAVDVVFQVVDVLVDALVGLMDIVLLEPAVQAG